MSSSSSPLASIGGIGGLGAILGGAGSLFGGLLGANASQTAASQYTNAIQQAIGLLEGNLQSGTANYSPYLNAGSTATRSLSSLLGTPGQGLLAPWTGSFTAPTAAEAQKTPGYQFQLKAGEDALQNSAAGQGSLLSGRTLAGLNNYAQGVASTNYQNTFNNAFTQYNSAYQSFLNNQNNTYSRLLGMSNQGLLGAQGEGSLLTGFGGDIASLYGAKGAAAAQGTIGAANAYGSIFPGLSNSLLNYVLLNKLGGGTNANLPNSPSAGLDPTIGDNPWFGPPPPG